VIESAGAPLKVTRQGTRPTGWAATRRRRGPRCRRTELGLAGGAEPGQRAGRVAAAGATGARVAFGGAGRLGSAQPGGAAGGPLAKGEWTGGGSCGRGLDRTIIQFGRRGRAVPRASCRGVPGVSTPPEGR